MDQGVKHENIGLEIPDGKTREEVEEEGKKKSFI